VRGGGDGGERGGHCGHSRERDGEGAVVRSSSKLV
jgi:hypothetical protein